MASSPKLLMLCADSADARLISGWAEAGLLPTWHSLIHEGLVLRVENPVGLYPGAVWPCFYTGVSPTRHGRYSLVQLQTGTYRTKPFDADDVKREPFWEPLGRAGRRIAVVDVPKSPFTANPNIVQLADWGTHDPERQGPRSWPESLGPELVARFGIDPVGQCDDYGRSGEMEQLRDRLLERVAKKQAILAHFLEQGDWDLLLGVFSESHCAGHHFWHLHDATHPMHDAALAAKLGDPLLDVYRAIDAALGRLVGMVGDQLPILVYASHGIGPHYDGTSLLDEVLRRLENVAPSPWTRLRDASAGLRRTLPWRRLLPSAMRRSGRALAGGFEGSALARDRRERTFFPLVTSTKCAGIRINLRGREPDGKVAPGAEYEALCDALSRDLAELVNADTGRPAVCAVHRVDRLFSRDRRDDFPDLLVEWNAESDIAALASPKIGEVRGRSDDPRTGDHQPNGMLIARAPDLPHGRTPASISVVDIAPTVAAALGVDLEDVDGQPIAQLGNLLAVPATGC